MYKSIITICLLFCLGVSAQLKLVDPVFSGANLNNTTLTVSGVPADSELQFALSIINTSTQTYTLKCKRTEVDVMAGTENITCWDTCAPLLVAGEFETMIIGEVGIEYTEVIAPNDTATSFLARYMPENLDGCSLFLYEFFDIANPNVILARVYGRFTHNVSTSCTASLMAKNDFEFSMSPNPTSGQLTLKTNDTNLSFQISDLLGRTVVYKTELLNNVLLDLDFLTSGVYFVSVLKHGIVLKTERVVVKH
jgi:hypothetical protein